MRLLTIFLVVLLVGCDAPLNLEQARSVLDHGCKNNGGIDEAYIYQSSKRTYLSLLYCKDGARFHLNNDWRGDGDAKRTKG